MTIREVLKLVTAYEFDLDDELKIAISSEPLQSGKEIKCEELDINGLDLFIPIWYEGDRCRLIAKKNKE